jgi:hypothetical protein
MITARFSNQSFFPENEMRKLYWGALIKLGKKVIVNWWKM